MKSAGQHATVSFLIVNKNDPAIRDTLQALEGIRSDLVSVKETVVVDASDDRLTSYRAEHPDVRWIPFTPRSDKPTIPEQRNVGVANCAGDIIVLIDASCVPEDGWVDRLVEPIVTEGEVVVAGAHRSSGKAGIRDQDARVLGEPKYVREAPTLNLAVVRSVFDRIGGFDERFSYGSDVDFTWRLNDAGIRIRYVPDAIVRHDWGAARSQFKRSWLYGQARYRLYAKHASRRPRVLKEDPVAVVYPLYLLLLPCALFQPWILGLLGVPLLRNRRDKPVLTLAHHLAYGAGVLSGVWGDVRKALRHAS